MTVNLFPQSPILSQAEAHRFFEVHIFTGAERREGGQHVPVVWSGDEKRIDIFSGDDFAKIAIRGAVLGLIPLVNLGAGQRELVRLHVANGYDLDILLRQKGVENGPASTPGSDTTDSDSAGSCRFAGTSED